MEKDILRMEKITKVYPNGFVANYQVNFSVDEGEIHALVGENGAGKSTLMKVLFGEEKPDEGRIVYKGEDVSFESPIQAIKRGIGMVHQHFMLVPSLTVAENMVLGAEPGNGGLFRLQNAIEITEEISAKYNLPVDPKARVADLPVGMKQRVEILKALLRGAKILILDEPTAVLTPQETQELFVEFLNLKKAGHTIIFISHKLQEIVQICDRLTVLRRGRSMGTMNVSETSEQGISRLMVGRDVVLSMDKKPITPTEPVLKVKNITMKQPGGKNILSDVSFTVRGSEIIGIAGVEGNGQRELSEIITGLTHHFDGEVDILGESIQGLSIRQIRERKTAHVPEDRMTYGCVEDASVLENIISDRYYKKEYNRHLLLDDRKLGKMTDELIVDYLIKCDDSTQPVRMLSGGNMQKVVAAREFSSSPRLVIANQPTRGIDVGASEFIRKKLIALRDEGCAILLISADLNEVLEVSDSIIVMSGGQIAAYYKDAKEATEEELGEYMLGIKKQSDAEIREVAYGQ